MSIRHVRTTRRAGAAALLAAALAFSLTACGEDPGTSKENASSSSSSGKQQPSKSGDGKTYPDNSKVVATLKGNDGIEMVIHEVKRDAGGFVTVSGAFKNTTQNAYTTPIQWSGQEQDVAGSGRSVAAMTLVDSKEKKRYYVLRDTDNRPLTTAGFDPSIAAGATFQFFAQFPAPPTSTTTVDLQFPGFPNAPIEIS
ncbi:hypothetical protein [Streptomyces solicathayae]|uniref:Lipoprotein n=1 Tax=Streptomyces solicathayae TaxID=3081768 RepID=A0ABZ0LSD7_9ACTN|nr:hypothetical protein [Streptomyces sp. HUAS YS2]WOX22354.1 hypothetical protein R2D22_13495 [Streptomyces sp. HUAS YS2]